MWIPDATALADFRRCPEVFRLRHRLHLRPPAEPKRDAGSATHIALDVWFRKPMSDVHAMLTALRLAMEPDAEAGPILQVNVAPRSLPHVERVLTEYSKVYPRERDAFEVVSNEQYVEGVIGVGKGGDQVEHDECDGRGCVCCNYTGQSQAVESFAYCGILDRKIRMPDGSEYVVDLKTTGSRWQDARLLALSDQLIGYVALERAAGRRCDGFYIDRIFLDDRTLAVKSEHFQRLGPFMMPEWRVRRWAEDVAWTLSEIARLESERGLDRPWPIYHNWAYGKPDDAWWPFIQEPQELHAQLLATCEREPWNPKDVAEQRRLVKLTAKLTE